MSLSSMPSPERRKVPLDTSFFSLSKKHTKLIRFGLGSLLLVVMLECFV